MNGLILVLNMGHLSSPFSYASSTGAHIYINNKTVRPSFFEGYEVATGSTTSLQLNRVFSKRKPKPFSNCISDIKSFGSVFTHKFAENNLTYSQKECFLYCYQRKLSDECHCVDSNFPLLTFNKPLCSSLEQFFCHMNLFSKFFNQELARNCTDCPFGIFYKIQNNRFLKN